MKRIVTMRLQAAMLLLCCWNLPLLIADQWRIQPGQANDIAVGANGHVWIVGNLPRGGGYSIHQWNGSNWNEIGGGAVRIAVDPSGKPWVVNNADQIFRWEGSRWTELPGKAKDIAIAANGDAWVLGIGAADAGGYSVHRWNGSNWDRINGSGNRIAAGPNGQPWVVKNDGGIEERLPGGAWKRYPGSARDIGAGANGSVWVIGQRPMAGSFSVHYWNNYEWVEVDGGGTQIAVDHAGRPWIVNHLKEIYRRVYTPNALSGAPAVSQLQMDFQFCGRISALAVNPNNPNHVMLAGESGGLFESINATAERRNWIAQTSFPNHSVTDILMTNRSSGVDIWVTTDNSYNARQATPQIWKRSGGTWSTVGFITRPGTAIPTSAYRIVKEKTTDRLYACGDFGLAVKEPGNESWSIRQGPAGSGLLSIESLAEGTLLGSNSTGMYYSSDQGRSWILATGGPALGLQDERFGLCSDPGGRVALATSLASDGMQVFSSTDNGRSWQRFATNASEAPGAAGGYKSVYLDFDGSSLKIFVSNKYKFVYARTVQSDIAAALRSMQNNPTLSWSAEIVTGHPDTRQIAFLRNNAGVNKMVITSDGGFHIADVSGSDPVSYTWVTEKMSSGLHALQVYNVTGDDRKIVFGTQDNGFGIIQKGARSMELSLGGEGYVVNKTGPGLPDPRQLIGPDIMIFGSEDGCNGDSRWVSPSVNAGRNPYGDPIWVGGKVYIQDAFRRAGEAGFPWKISVDNGCSWTDLPRSLYVRFRSDCRFGNGVQFSSSETSALNLFAALDNGGRTVLGRLPNPVSNLRGNFWQYPRMEGLAGGIAESGRVFLRSPLYAVHPGNPERMLAVARENGKLCASSDGGNTWSELAAFNELYENGGQNQFRALSGEMAIWALAFSPYDPNVVLVGTVTEGIFISRDAGARWSRIASPGVFMPTGFHWLSPQEIVVGTYGRGLFMIRM